MSDTIKTDPRCGSDPGYQAHRRRGEQPCEECRVARNAERRAREQAKPKARRLDTTPSRFWNKVAGGDFEQCWEWIAYRDANGYGRFGVGGRAGRMEMAHRVAYLLMVDDIPPGLELDHLCRNRGCVNPYHLEPVTHQVNSRRSAAGEVNGNRQRSVTHCPAGHPYDAENTRRKSSGSRTCRACERTQMHRRYQEDPEKYRELARQSRARQKAGTR
jgi:hypothetical protein